MNSSDKAKTPPLRRKNLPGKFYKNVAETLLQQYLKCLKNHCFLAEKMPCHPVEDASARSLNVTPVEAPRHPPEKQFKLQTSLP